jgi:hypothetical protein
MTCLVDASCADGDETDDQAGRRRMLAKKQAARRVRSKREETEMNASMLAVGPLIALVIATAPTRRSDPSDGGI